MRNIKDAKLWLARAEDTLGAAKLNFGNDLLIASVNRAYYSMFYCVSSLLILEDFRVKTHKGLQTKFYELFIKTEKINTKYSLIIRKAFEYRQSADYELEANISEEECEELIENAKDFYSVCENYILNLNR
jgi:uncharacterized protein (UPF0332 family)